MKTHRCSPALLPLSFVAASLLLGACSKSDHTSPVSVATAPVDAAKQPKRYPLKGVVTDILPEQSALLVKHEAIPGFMGAMTMMFKVDAATLKAVAKGQAITGTLVEARDEFHLEDVKPVAP